MSFTLDQIIAASKPSSVPEEIKKMPFADGIWPWMRVGRERLRAKAKRELKNLLPGAIFSMEKSLMQRWVQVAAPSFALELSITKMQDELHGETSRDRYFDFVQRKFWNSEGLRAFFDEYKELARKVVVLLELWEVQTVEFLRRLDADLPLLAKSYNGGEPLGKVLFLEQNAGDFHEGGRSVYHLKFECGKELFYKPKDLSFAKAFHALLDELNAQGLPLGLKGHKILALEDHGWEERVLTLPCETKEQVSRYFERAGMLLCILYLFDGTDIHFENIIAYGEYPILIDLETFFHSEIAHPEKKQVASIFNHSVLRAALLPVFVEKEGKRGPDISGLSGEAEAFSAMVWKEIDTDELTRIEEKIREDQNTHRVVFEGKLQGAHEHVEEIVRGFRTMYKFVQERREMFVQKGGWVDRLAEFPVRMVVRATRLYAYLLERLASPVAMLHEEEREKELQILSRLLLEPGLEHLQPLIEEERRALLQGDVPFFTTYPKENHLYSGNHFVLEGCLEGTSHASALNRIENMNEEECEKQEVFIRKSFYAKQAGFHVQDKHQKRDLPLVKKELQEKEILEEALSIGRELLNQSFRSRDGSLGWISLEPNPQFGRFELQPISDNLYGGSLGIALFFSALFAKTQEEQWKESALSTVKSFRSMIERGSGGRLTNLMGIGGMSGMGSAIYGFSKMGVLLRDPSFFADAGKLAASITDKHIENDNQYDIIGGSAGLILGLLALWEKTQEKTVFDLALKAAEHLISKAEEMPDGGVAWKNRDGMALLGFSHGVAGIAFALLRMTEASKNPVFTQLGQRALAYERAHFCPERKNWPRFDPDSAPGFPVQWCHGATGIGFARLASMPLLSDPYFAEEVEVAVKQTEEHFLTGERFNVCCGGSGKLEFLRSASTLFPALKQDLGSRIASLVTHYKTHPQEYFDPSFMQGSAGVGYTLLRAIDKEGVLPQVLLME